MNQEEEKRFFEGSMRFIELCGKHPDIMKEFVDKLQKAERGEPTTTELEKFIEEEAERRIEQLRKEGKIVKK